MSYVIHLFEHAGPATLAEAASLQQRLSQTRAAPNARFAQWARGIVARYPAGHAGWLEGPPDGDTDGMAVLSCGLTNAGLDDLLGAAVGLALPLGLCVFDEQAGRCYLPGGWAHTRRGRFALKAREQPPAPAAPAARASIEYGSTPWAQQRLLQRMGPGMASAGFKGFLGPHTLRFARLVPMGIQSLNVLVRDGVRFELAAQLGPVWPHALWRAFRPGRKLACFTHEAELLQPFHCEMERRPGHHPWIKLHAGTPQIDALADALQAWARDNFLPLFDACRDVPAILRSERQSVGQRTYVAGGHAVLALAHWTGADVRACAEDLIERCGEQVVPWRLRTTAEKLASLPQWKGAWRPLQAPCQLYEQDQAVTAPALAEAWLPRLRAVALAQGFRVEREEALALALVRSSDEVTQTLHLKVEALPFGGARFEVAAGWQGTGLWDHWRHAIGTSSDLPEAATAGWAPHFRWAAGDLEALGLDALDLQGPVKWPDQVADQVRSAEQALQQLCERLLAPAMSWRGAAERLLPPAAYDPVAGQVTGPILRSLGSNGCAAVLMLSSLFRPADTAGYAMRIRSDGLHAEAVGPILDAAQYLARRTAP